MYNIGYPMWRSEFEIQAELYSLLKCYGYDVRGEVSAHKSRLDLVVYLNKRARVIIECKSYKSDKDPVVDTKQFKKYSKFNIPVLLCVRLKDIDSIIDKVRSYIKS